MPDENTFKEKRIKDAASARALYNKLRSKSSERRNVWARVQGQLDGAAPFIQKELIDSGQGWRCNINFRDASSALEQVLISYWRLLHDTTNIAAVTVHSDDPNSELWGSVFQDAFNRFITDWGPDYVRNYLLFSTNHVSYGVGIVVWNEKNCPRWEVVRLGDIEVPEKTKSSIKAMSLAMVRQEFGVEELYEYIRPGQEEPSAKAGWNIPELKRVLAQHIVQPASTVNEADVIAVQEQLRSNSLGVSSDHAPIRLVNCYVKEFDGKVSTYVFAEKIDHSEFLFDDSSTSGRPDSMEHRMAAVFFEAGNGLFWGTKGFGVKNYPIASVTNRLKSRAVDRTLLDGLNFRDLSDGGRTRVPIVSHGPFNFLPKDVDQIPQYPAGRSTLETIAMLDQQSSFNNARYRESNNQIAQSNTATQARILAGLQAQVDVANATLYLHQIARSIFVEQFRRLRLRGSDDEDAKVFRRRCVDDAGMPEKIFHDAEISVVTGADPGAASLELQAEFAKELFGLSNDPNVNNRWALEKFVSSRFGAQAVRKALRPPDALGDIAAQRAALMENSDMGEGMPLPVDPKDPHHEHLPLHLQPLQVIIDQYTQSGQLNPDHLIALQNGVPHVKAHLEYLKADKFREQVYRQLLPVATSIENRAAAIFRQLERMDAQANGTAQQGMSLSGAVGATTPQ